MKYGELRAGLSRHQERMLSQALRAGGGIIVNRQFNEYEISDLLDRELIDGDLRLTKDGRVVAAILVGSEQLDAERPNAYRAPQPNERLDTCATDRFPFAGIVERPYDQDQLSVTWSYVKPEWVFLPDLWLTQTKVTIEGLFGKTYSTDQFPRAVRYRSGPVGPKKVFLEDGHHRIVSAAKRGEQWAQIRVWDWPHGT